MDGFIIFLGSLVYLDTPIVCGFQSSTEEPWQEGLRKDDCIALPLIRT